MLLDSLTHPEKIPQRNKMYIHNSIKILRFWAIHSSPAMAWRCGRVRVKEWEKQRDRKRRRKKRRQLSATILLQNNKAACVPYHDHFISVQCSLNINKTSFQPAKCKTEEKSVIYIIHVSNILLSSFHKSQAKPFIHSWHGLSASWWISFVEFAWITIECNFVIKSTGTLWEKI